MFSKIFDIVAKWTCANCGRALPFGGQYCALCAPHHPGEVER